jgi:hypothetical protein
MSYQAGGFDAQSLREAGYTLGELRRSGFDDRRLLQAGFMEEITYEFLCMLYAATNSRGTWLNTSGWGSMGSSSTTMPYKDWYGVHTRTMTAYDGKDFEAVVELDLRSNGLTGMIPGNVWVLSYLRILRLSGNQIARPLPKSLKHLAHLEYIDIYDDDDSVDGNNDFLGK